MRKPECFMSTRIIPPATKNMRHMQNGNEKISSRYSGANRVLLSDIFGRWRRRQQTSLERPFHHVMAACRPTGAMTVSDGWAGARAAGGRLGRWRRDAARARSITGPTAHETTSASRCYAARWTAGTRWRSLSSLDWNESRTYRITSEATMERSHESWTSRASVRDLFNWLWSCRTKQSCSVCVSEPARVTVSDLGHELEKSTMRVGKL